MAKRENMSSVWQDARVLRRCASGFDWNTFNDSEYLYFGDDNDASFYADGVGVKIKGPLDFTATTLTPDANRTYRVWHLGNRVTEKDVTMAAAVSQNFDPIQLNINVIGANPTSTSTTNLIYANITHDTTNMAALRLKCADWNIIVAKNILDAYVYQGEIDITANSAIGSEATVMGLTMSVSAGTVTGIVRGLGILMSGASMPAATSAGYSLNVGGGATITHGIILATQGGTTLTNAIYIEQGGTLTNLLKFDATSAAVVSTASGGGTRSYSIRCAVGGVTGYLSLYTD